MTAPLRPPAPEDADWFRFIGREWNRIAACMFDERIADERIAAMFDALMDQCAVPRQPTSVEAGEARQALIAEITALGIEPNGGAEHA